ncbi:hypothetical protein DRP04_07110 [Archaeoglobales archaeon]|nr:MAG: hypothetical protein DRP04_07110 [Archaeoglobales archaeon]
MRIEDYINYLKDIGRIEAAERYYYALKNFEEWLKSKGKTLDDFTSTDVEKFLVSISNPHTANIALAAIRGYTAYRVKECPFDKFIYEDRRFHAIEEIPYRKISTKLTEDKKTLTIVRKALTPDEVKELIEMTESKPLLQAGIVTTFYFGWRPVEATLRLAKAKIDWKNRIMTIQGAKTQDERFLVWHDSITPYLRTWYKAQPLYKRWLTMHLCSYNINGVKVTAKVGRKTVETQLRKAFVRAIMVGETIITPTGKTGVEQFLIDSWLGHKTTPIQDIYTDLSEFITDLKYLAEEKHYLVEVLS